MMKPCLIIAALLFAPACARAQARKPREELKSEIAAKLEAKGATSYTLDIVAKDRDVDGKVVGTCDGGTRKMVYRRGAGSPGTPATAKDASKP